MTPEERERTIMEGPTFIDADGPLAETMCGVTLLNLTPTRARKLHQLHRRHLPRRCSVMEEALEELQVRGWWREKEGEPNLSDRD